MAPGYLAGWHAAKSPQAAPAAPPAAKTPLTILYGTESGNAEALAGAARKVAQRLGFAARTLDMADATPEQVAASENLLVIASTWGEGDPPQRAEAFHAALLADAAPRFERVRYAVLALGDRAYAKFCETGRVFDDRLAALGGVRAAERVECDLDYETQAKAWIDASLRALEPENGPAVIHVDFARAEPDAAFSRARPFEAEVTARVNLNSSRSTIETIHLELSLEGSGLAYEPGDSLGFLPINDPALVEDLLRATRLDGDATLHGQLRDKLDITDRPIIMIGPGTGVAPFRAFLQQREATGARGPAWLFFGARNFTHDFLYQLEFQDWLKSGVLSRMDVAFSRDQPEKIYVQHRMWQARRELFRWLADGAILYVCGDAAAMAKDVHATLLRIGEDQSGQDAAGWLRGLQQRGQYLRDVY